MKHRLVAIVVLALLVSGCGAATRAYRKGQEYARAGEWDAAIVQFTKAVQEDPEQAAFKISLERATQTASREHLTRARDLEQNDQLDAAMIEYRKAVDLDSTNRLASARVAALERIIRDRIEASRPKPPIEELRRQARAQGAPPLLDPSSREPLRFTFGQSSLKDILNFIGTNSGINITYDQTFADKAYGVTLDGVTLEEALQQIMAANQLFYKVVNPKTIIVVPDTAAKHTQYDDLVVRVFYVSHADVTELTQILNTVMRIPTMPVQPTMLPNKTANTITVRASAPVVDIIERIIKANDKPRAEVVIDVQILEVNKKRARDLGLNLSNYALGLTFSPETAPAGGNPTFNVNTISQGVSAADFYLTVPTATIKFLEQDAHTKLIAKPQLRGAEGTKLTLNLGDRIPVLSTVFGAAAAGGFASVPQSSFNYQDVGVNVTMTPRVTYEGDIILDGLEVESSALGPNISVAGQDVPSFSSRKITTKLRLREGESNLLAGLLRDEQRKIITGFPGVTRTPILRSLFGATNDEITQSDIVMLLTPHVVRTHELTVEDLAPIFIGTQQNVGLGGPPPLIAPVPPPADAATGAAAPGAPGQPVAPGTQKPALTGEGGSPQPGRVTVPGTSPTPLNPSPVPTLTPPSAANPTISPNQPQTMPPAASPNAAPGNAPPANPPSPNAPAPNAPTPNAPPRDPNAPPGTQPGAPTAPGAPSPTQIIVTSAPEFRVAGGPYTVPVSINNAQRVSVLSLSVTFNPNVLRVRTVQQGTVMQQGGATVSFTPRIDPTGGRVDIAVARTGDQTGVTGNGLVAVLLFDAVGPGNSTIQANGVANAPDGSPIQLQFSPVSVTVR